MKVVVLPWLSNVAVTWAAIFGMSCLTVLGHRLGLYPTRNMLSTSKIGPVPTP
jgi:hypothetical protein